MGANTKYKDSVFSFLFSDPDVLRELYGALAGLTLPPDVPVTINTLRDVLFMDRVNDLSFTIGGTLVILVEHQSTINPNMAIRLLMYIARVYEKILGDKNLYASRALAIPRPEFFVLYNGTAPYPDEQGLKLSDSFLNPASLGLPEKESPALDLVVRVININQGRNEGIVRRCTVLNGYSAFVARVREYEKELGGKEEALKAAIKYCREHDILKEFLERHSSEVMNMLLTEWNWDDALAVRYEEGLETGMEKGREEGLERGLEKGLERGLEKGLERGREEGRLEGREETARYALIKGMSPEDVSEITGLDLETVNKIAGQ